MGPYDRPPMPYGQAPRWKLGRLPARDINVGIVIFLGLTSFRFSTGESYTPGFTSVGRLFRGPLPSGIILCPKEHFTSLS